jgi:hypothetical protein
LDEIIPLNKKIDELALHLMRTLQTLQTNVHSMIAWSAISPMVGRSTLLAPPPTSRNAQH